MKVSSLFKNKWKLTQVMQPAAHSAQMEFV